MIAPTMVPTTIEAKTPVLLNVVLRNAIWPSGSSHITTKYDAATVKSMAVQLPMFNAVCTLDVSSLMVTKKVPMIEKMIPKPHITIGSRIGDKPPKLSLTVISCPSTIVAKMVATYEPKRSAPMPATSPTLSPTLSAIVAGLRTSSSGIPASTLPTRSAPTSAAFVYIPPPTRANNAIDSAPNEKPVSTSIVISISGPLIGAPVGTKYILRTMNNPLNPNTARPATPRPITEPPVKETDNALLKLVRAACAVLTFAFVATLIPI